MSDECGRRPEDQQGFICDVCGDVIPKGAEIWIDSYRDKPKEVPAHENCRHHTCENMLLKNL